jgi:hypothetical protein
MLDNNEHTVCACGCWNLRIFRYILYTYAFSIFNFQISRRCSHVCLNVVFIPSESNTRVCDCSYLLQIQQLNHRIYNYFTIILSNDGHQTAEPKRHHS